MKKINLNNYQAYMLDYVEGNLNEIEQAELFLFLEQQPELKRELEEFENISVSEELDNDHINKDQFKKTSTPDELLIGYIENTLSTEEKKSLEKQLSASSELKKQLSLYQHTISEADETLVYENKHELERLTVIDEQLIAYVEKKLSKQENEKVEQLIGKDSELKKELRLVQATLSKADTSIIFPYKEELKRKTKIVYLPQFELKYVAMAASVLLLIGLFFIFNQGRTSVSANRFAALKNYEIKLNGSNVLKKQEVQEPSQKNEIRQFASKAVVPKNNKTKQVMEDPVVNEQPLVVQTIVNDTATKNNKDVIASSNAALPKIIVNKEVDNSDDEAPALAANPTNKQYLANKIKESAWGEDERKLPDAAKKKLSGFDVLAAVAKKLKNLGNKKADAKVEYDDETERSEYTLTLGNISVSKTRSIPE